MNRADGTRNKISYSSVRVLTNRNVMTLDVESIILNQSPVVVNLT